MLHDLDHLTAARKHHTDIADSLEKLGNVLAKLKNLPQARKHLEEALVIRRKTIPENHFATAFCLISLGSVLQEQGELEASLRHRKQALAALNKETPEPVKVFLPIINMMRELLAKEHTEEWRKDLPRMQKLWEELLLKVCENAPENDLLIALPHICLGIVLDNQGNLAEARKHYEKALALRRKALPRTHPDIADSLLHVASVCFRQSEVARAEELLQEANTIIYEVLARAAFAQEEAEQLALTRSHANALDWLLSATAARGRTNTVYPEVLAFKGVVTARQRWLRLVRSVADQRTLKKLQELRQTNRELVAAGLVDVRHPLPANPSKMLEELTARRGRLERELADLSADFRQQQDRSPIGSRELRAALPEATCLVDFVEYTRYSLDKQNPPEIQEEQHLLAFVLRREQQEAVLVDLGPSEPLAALIDQWRATYSSPKPLNRKQLDPGAELRRLLWEPLATHLNGVRTVLLSPDGPLHALPFAALPGSKPSTFLLEEFTFAIVPVPQLIPELLSPDAPKLQPPSILLMGNIDFNAKLQIFEAAGAGRAAPRFQYGPLPETDKEVDYLSGDFAKAFPGKKVTLLTEATATKAAFLKVAAEHRFLHLATHGFFAKETVPSALAPATRFGVLRGEVSFHSKASGWHPGLLSGVVFAGVNRGDQPSADDGILTALEVTDLDLRGSELVVLSACSTGRGKVAGGEGVLGLQRAFQLTGARTVVASLWDVDDKYTRDLMSDFYRNLWKKKLPKAVALRQAQLSMLEKGRVRAFEREAPAVKKDAPLSPHYWAAFVLSGDWR